MVTSRRVDEELDIYVHRRYPDIFEGTASEDEIALATQNDPRLSEYLGQVASAPSPEPQPDPSIASRVIDFLGDTGRSVLGTITGDYGGMGVSPQPAPQPAPQPMPSPDRPFVPRSERPFMDNFMEGMGMAGEFFPAGPGALAVSEYGLETGVVGGTQKLGGMVGPRISDPVSRFLKEEMFAIGPRGFKWRPLYDPEKDTFWSPREEELDWTNYPQTVETFRARPLGEQIVAGLAGDVAGGGIYRAARAAPQAISGAIDFLGDQGPAITRQLQGLAAAPVTGLAGGGPGAPRRGPGDPRFDDIVSRLGEAEAAEAAELQRIQGTISPEYPGMQADPDVPAFASDLFAKTGIRNVPIEQLPQDKLHYVLVDPETGKASLEIVDNTRANRDIHADLQLPRTDPQDPSRVVQSRLASPDLGSGTLGEEFAGDLGVMGDTLENRALLAANRLNRGFTTVQTRGQTRTVQTPGSFREQGVIPYSRQMEGLQRLEEGRGVRSALPDIDEYRASLTEDQAELFDLYQDRDALAEESGFVRKPERGDYGWSANKGLTDEHLIAIARLNDLDPYEDDWFRNLDELVLRSYRPGGRYLPVEKLLAGSGIDASEIPSSGASINRNLTNINRRIRELERVGTSLDDTLPTPGEPIRGPRPYEGTGQQERLIPGDQSLFPGYGVGGSNLTPEQEARIPSLVRGLNPEQRADWWYQNWRNIILPEELAARAEIERAANLEARGPRPYTGTGTQEGLIPGDPPVGAGGPPGYPPDTGARQQYLPTDYGVSEVSRRLDPVEEVPPYDISGIRGEAGAELGLDVSQALPEGYQVSGPPVSQPRREFRFPRTDEEPWEADPLLPNRIKMRIQRATDPEWQDYNASKRGTEDFFSWKIRKAREAGELETQAGGAGSGGARGDPDYGSGAGLPWSPETQAFTPQGLPGMPSGQALGATVEHRPGIGQVVKAGTGEDFELDVLYQTDASRASASDRALGKKPTYGKAYSQREAQEYERLAATSKISDEDRARYLEWVNGKQPLTDEDRALQRFIMDQADFFGSRIHGVRSKGNPKRWEVTPEEGYADFTQFIAWTKGNAAFPAKYRMQRLGEEMRDLRQGDIITEDDVRDMSPSLRNLYYEYIASEFKDLEANESIIKRWMNLRRTVESDVEKRVGGQKLWNDFTDWANTYGLERGFGSMTPQGDYWQEFLPSMQEHSFIDPAAGVAKNAFEIGLEVLACWRAIRSSYDLGWHLRQGAVIMANNPSAWVRSWGPTLKSLGNEQVARAMESQFYKYPIIQRALNPNLEEPLFVAQRGARRTGRETPAEEALRAEEYTSEWASKIPGIPMSERAFTVAGNVTRMQALIDITERWESLLPGNPASRVIDSIFGVNEDLRGAPVSEAELQDLVRLVNYATGRGVFRLKVGTKIDINWEGKAVVRLLNRVMFSPRLQLARFQTPFMIFSKNPRVRKEAARMMVRYWGFLTSVLGIFYAGSLVNKDIRVDVDRNSPNFGRVSWGRQTFDFTAGHQSWYRYLTQFVAGGNRPEGRTEMRKINRDDTAWRLWRSKGSPGMGEVYNQATREDFVGNKIEYPTSVKGVISTGERLVNSGAPMTFVDILEGFELNTYQSWRAPITKFARMVVRGEDPDPRFAQNLGRRLRQGTTAGIAGVLGEGINTYMSVDDILHEMEGIPYGGEIWPSDRYRALQEANRIEPPQGDYSQKVLDNHERLVDQIDQIVKGKVRETPVEGQAWRDVEPIDGEFWKADDPARAYVRAYYAARKIWREKAREIAVDEFGPKQFDDPETIEDPKERARAKYLRELTSMKATAIGSDEEMDRNLRELMADWDDETKTYVLSSQYLGSEDIVTSKMRRRLRDGGGEKELRRIEASEKARKEREVFLVRAYQKERTQMGHIWSGGSTSPANRRVVE